MGLEGDCLQQRLALGLLDGRDPPLPVGLAHHRVGDPLAQLFRLPLGRVPGELAARTGLTTGPTTRLIDRLEQAGYMRRVPDANDRRKVLVEPVGRPADLDRMLAPRQKGGEILLGYTPEQREVLFDYFDRTATAFQETVEEIE
ncbi:MarR family transcriptional regulator [Nocardia sp. CT2-14]|uniref:MarR family transcriptional regulator n=1 Tax=Nocardia aurantiaca TaxID=2675850 RepID=A0A6I3KQB1_9NOCA|nr:MarR family transcriptional regulator [Nocardia aurantiaca]